MAADPAILLLVRHATTDAVGQWLAGRRDVELNAQGHAEADTLARKLAGAQIASVYSSPRSRAIATALVIGRPHRLQPIIAPNLDEVDFGEWTGRRFDALAGDPSWRAFNRDRQSAAPPAGEPLRDVVERARCFIDLVTSTRAGELVVAVTHADVIRCAISALSGIDLDSVARFQISPAHVTVARLWPEWAELTAVNVAADGSDLAC